MSATKGDVWRAFCLIGATQGGEIRTGLFI